MAETERRSFLRRHRASLLVVLLIAVYLALEVVLSLRVHPPQWVTDLDSFLECLPGPRPTSSTATAVWWTGRVTWETTQLSAGAGRSFPGNNDLTVEEAREWLAERAAAR